jgi:hypothetical protein
MVLSVRCMPASGCLQALYGVRVRVRHASQCRNLPSAAHPASPAAVLTQPAAARHGTHAQLVTTLSAVCLTKPSLICSAAVRRHLCYGAQLTMALCAQRHVAPLFRLLARALAITRRSTPPPHFGRTFATLRLARVLAVNGKGIERLRQRAAGSRTHTCIAGRSLNVGNTCTHMQLSSHQCSLASMADSRS